MEFLREISIVDNNLLQEINNLEINNVVKAGVMTAALHLISGREKIYPWKILGIDAPSKIETSYTISIDDPSKTLKSIENSKYPIIKIKMGSENDDGIIDILREVSGKLFRVDANGGWIPEVAEKMIYELSRLNVDIIEQPTDLENIADWKYIKGRSKVCLMIDEGLGTLDDYNKYADYVDGINIKMAKSGGLLNALEIVKQAKKDKLKVMLGCMVESSVAISQAVYLSSMADYYDFDGAMLLENDPAVGLCYSNERIMVDEAIIGGPKLKEEYVREYEK